ncbi:MAG: phosphorylase [Candidatus Sulfotelmatobacter sp.]
MPKVAIVAALEREVAGFIRGCRRVERHHEGRSFTFFEQDEVVVVCGGIGLEAARRASEAVISLYHPCLLYSVGFAGALTAELRVGDLIESPVVIDARDGSRPFAANGDPQSLLVTFMSVAGVQQKTNLAQAYGAKAVDMEAAAVAVAASAHGIGFTATKVISDELNFEMPQMERFIDARGQFRTGHFARFVALRPWLWNRVLALSSNSRKAAKILGAHLKLLRQELSLKTGQASDIEVRSHTVPQPVPASASRAGGRE